MAVGNITNVIPASELPVMTEAEYLANVNTLTVDGTGKLKQLPRGDMFNLISTVVQKGEKGDKGNTGATGATGARGEKGDKGNTGATGATGANGATGATGAQGFNGWTPVLSIVNRGASDQVLQVVNWTNPNPSATNKPSFPVYIGATGFTTNIAEAINIKGSQGLQGLRGIQGANGANGTNGTNGWSPVVTLIEDTSTSLVYFYLGEWVGGTGAPPTTIGYISQDGVTPEPVVGSDVGSLPLSVSFSDIADKPTTLSGYGIVDTADSLSEGVTNKYFSEVSVRNSKLTNLNTTTASEVIATDNLITAIGKLQAQITAGIGGSGGNVSLMGVTNITDSSEVSDTDDLITAIGKVQNQIRQITPTTTPPTVSDLGGEGYYPYSVTDGTLYTESQVITLTQGSYRILICGSPSHTANGFSSHTIVTRYDTSTVLLASNNDATISNYINSELQGRTHRNASSSLIPEGSFSPQGHWIVSEGFYETNRDDILKYVFDTAASVSQPAQQLGTEGNGSRGGALALSKIITVPSNSTLKLALEIPPPAYLAEYHDPTNMGTGFVWIREITT